jgi:polar amino acid transport system substrate-binding protein
MRMDQPKWERRAALGLAVAGVAGVASAQAADDGGSTWERIHARKELRIGVAASEPWFRRDPATGGWSGLGTAVGEAMARDLDVKLVPVETTWGNAVAGLQANQFDVMFILDATPQRALAVDFPVQPLFYYAQGLLVRDGIDAKTWAGLNRADFRVAVTLGTAPDRDITARLPLAAIQRFATNDQATLAFQSGHVDAVCFYHPALLMQRAQVKMGTVVLPEPVRASTTSGGVRREADKTFRDWLGTAMDFYYVTGQTQAMFVQYLASRGIDAGSAPGLMKELWRST